MNSSKRKGDRAELEVQALLRDLLGVPARRKLGAGRRDDTGDIEGLPNTTVQVKSYVDVGRAVRECLDDLTEQHERSGNTFAAGFVRRPGGRYFVVLSPEMYATFWREAVAPWSDEPPIDVVGEIRERDALGEWALHMYDERDDQETD